MIENQALNQATRWPCNRICDPCYHHWQERLIQHNEAWFLTGNVLSQVKATTQPWERELNPEGENTVQTTTQTEF